MLRFRIFKDFKKKLKRKRRHVWSLGIGAVLFVLAALVGAFGAHRIVGTFSEREAPDDSVSVWSDNLLPDGGPADPARERVLRMLRDRRGEVEVVLHRSYWCGEETRKLGSQTAVDAEALLTAHRDWEAKFDASGRFVMEEKVEDLSPACRLTAYISVDEQGNLSLYDGKPKQDHVIRTFFQLDVETMKTSLSPDKLRELTSGIRVSDKDEYNSVLSTFSDFAKQRTES